MLTDTGKWARPAISSHAVQWSSMRMWMPLEPHMQQHCGAPDDDFRNPSSRLDMPVATEQMMEAMGLVRALSQGC